MRFCALLLVLVLMFAGKAYAIDPTMIIGTWVEKYDDGSSQVTVFTKDTMASYALDATGKKTSESAPLHVTYIDGGSNAVTINFDAQEDIKVTVTSLNDITLDYSGAVTHDLTRMKEDPKPKVDAKKKVAK